MAIYHCSVKVISRSSGRSSTAAAAYRAAEKIEDQRTGLTHDFTRKHGVDFSTVITPDNSPTWAKNRAELWNKVEKVEKRKDSQVCREVEVSLPRELSKDQMKSLAIEYATSQFVSRGMIADINIHHADGANPHAHILLTTRTIDKNGFGKKDRSWNEKSLLQEWRVEWEKHANRSLELAGHDQKIDHRTLEAQGIERIPQIHMGPKVIQMEQRGKRTDIGTKALAIDKVNAEIIDLQRYREAISNGRTFETSQGEEFRRVSKRDRAISSSNGDAFRGARAINEYSPSPASSSSRNLEGNDGRINQSVESNTTKLGRNEEKNRRIDKDNDRYVKEFEMEIEVGRGDRFSDRYSGATGRIVSLVGSANRTARGRNSMDSSHNKRGVDRTYLAVKRHLKGLKCNAFEVGIKNKNGKMMLRSWSHDEVLSSVDWLKRENAKGADIYIRPHGDKNQGLILVDDLTRTQLSKLEQMLLKPALTVETSPQNYQAWIRLSDEPIEPEIATTASKAIAKHFGADLNSADWKHFGRLAGFTNRKPEHMAPNGHNPWVLCHESGGEKAIRGDALLHKAKEAVIEKHAEDERKTRLRASKTAVRGDYGRHPIKEYQKQLATLTARYSDDMDVSRADYMICCDMAKNGYTREEILNALDQASPELPIRKAGHEQDYCNRTVEAAFSNSSVKQHIESNQINHNRPSINFGR